jgi:hypothetical protein
VSEADRPGADLTLAASLLLARTPRRFDPSPRARAKAQADTEQCLAIAERIVAAVRANDPPAADDVELLQRARERLPRAAWAKGHTEALDLWIGLCAGLAESA